MKANAQETLKEVKTMKINYSILTIIVLIAVVIGVTWYISHLQNIMKLSPGKQTNAPILEKIKGVVRTDGLTIEEKQKYDLSDVNFQITNIEPNIADNIKYDIQYEALVS